MKYGMVIGTPSESVIAAGNAIMKIMNYKASDDVKVAALRAIAVIIDPPTQATITGCTIMTKPIEKKRKKR